MESQTLYEVLEVSKIASDGTIRAARDRLSAQWDPARPHNADPEARARYDTIQNAYWTLGNPQKRAAYDRTLSAASPVPVKKTPTVVHAIALALFAVVGGAYHYSGRQEEVRMDAASAVAPAKTIEPKQVEAKAEVKVAGRRQENLDGDRAGRLPGQRERSESLALKLNTELASGQQLVGTPLTQR